MDGNFFVSHLNSILSIKLQLYNHLLRIYLLTSYYSQIISFYFLDIKTNNGKAIKCNMYYYWKCIENYVAIWHRMAYEFQLIVLVSVKWMYMSWVHSFQKTHFWSNMIDRKFEVNDNSWAFGTNFHENAMESLMISVHIMVIICMWQISYLSNIRLSSLTLRIVSKWECYIWVTLSEQKN